MILQDKLIIQKTSHSAHILSVYKRSKMVFRKQLSTKDFLKHDLLHTALHFLTSGDIFQPEDETMQMEFIA